MNIQTEQNSNNISMYGKGKSWSEFFKNSKQALFDKLPNKTFKESEKRLKQWVKTDEFISRPDNNRAIMGVTAIAIQPVIDANNNRVDKDTRKVSVCRTIAKIIAGTFVGILVRKVSLKFINSTTNIKGHAKWSKMLLPKKYINEMANNKVFLSNYQNIMANLVALIAMCYTNFKCDAPLTTFLTNYFLEQDSKKLNNGGDKHV